MQYCVEILIEGCVQSYVDYFYVTQRRPTGPVSPAPLEALMFIKSTLISAEKARGNSSTLLKSYELYSTLATYLQKVYNSQLCLTFFRVLTFKRQCTFTKGHRTWRLKLILLKMRPTLFSHSVSVRRVRGT
jgi:hypothetical protein